MELVRLKQEEQLNLHMTKADCLNFYDKLKLQMLGITESLHKLESAGAHDSHTLSAMRVELAQLYALIEDVEDLLRRCDSISFVKECEGCDKIREVQERLEKENDN